MPPISRSTHDDVEWTGVSEKHPCPICASSEGCRLHADDAFACCSRRPSDWPLTNGAWLHRIEPAAAGKGGFEPLVLRDASPLRLRS